MLSLTSRRDLDLMVLKDLLGRAGSLKTGVFWVDVWQVVHDTAGVLGAQFSIKHPDKVRSLSLLVRPPRVPSSYCYIG